VGALLLDAQCSYQICTVMIFCQLVPILYTANSTQQCYAAATEVCQLLLTLVLFARLCTSCYCRSIVM
jgi:hypothetical protein